MRISTVVIAAAIAAFAGAAAAQPFPARPITLVVPFAAGGSNDILARVIGERLSKAVNQSVVIDNQSGASGSIGAARVAKSDPDGYTLLVISTTFTINPAVQKQSFDSVNGFAPVALIGTSPMLVTVAPRLGLKSPAELLTLARANPGKLNYGSAGNGSITQIGAELLKLQTGIQIGHVPYRGVPLAVNDLLGGHIEILVASLPAVLEQVRGGKLTALAVTSKRRNSFLPDLPTLDETVAPGYELIQWWGILAPAGTPPDVIATLNGEINKILETVEVKATLAREGAEATPASPDALSARIREEIPRWQKLAKDGYIRAE